jgi:hypothetical protein
MLVSLRGLAQLNAEGGVELLDNEGNTVSFNTRLLRHFVEFHGRTPRASTVSSILGYE